MKLAFRVWDNEKNDWLEPIYEAYKGRLFDMLINRNGDLIFQCMGMEKEGFDDGMLHESLFPGRFKVYLKDANRIIEGERAVNIPSIVRHFRGNLYAVMGYSEPVAESTLDSDMNIDEDKLSNDGYIYTKHTETGETLLHLPAVNCKWIHNKELADENLVLYKSLYDCDNIWARPIKSFLEKLDKEKYPEATQEYRFQEVFNDRNLD